jgi:hypothetical protein
MVTINVKLLDKSNGATSGDNLRVAAVNANANNYVEKLRTQTAGLECLVHVPGHGDITVIADLTDTVRMEKSGFCCQAFEDSMEFTVKK